MLLRPVPEGHDGRGSSTVAIVEVLLVENEHQTENEQPAAGGQAARHERRDRPATTRSEGPSRSSRGPSRSRSSGSDGRGRGGYGGRRRGGPTRRRRGKVCAFCVDKVSTIDYKDIKLLRDFVTDHGKIKARRKTGTCAKHQRRLAVAIKRARHIALLPYAAEHTRRR